MHTSIADRSTGVDEGCSSAGDHVRGVLGWRGGLPRTCRARSSDQSPAGLRPTDLDGIGRRQTYVASQSSCPRPARCCRVEYRSLRTRTRRSSLHWASSTTTPHQSGGGAHAPAASPRRWRSYRRIIRGLTTPVSPALRGRRLDGLAASKTNGRVLCWPSHELRRLRRCRHGGRTPHGRRGAVRIWLALVDSSAVTLPRGGGRYSLHQLVEAAPFVGPGGLHRRRLRHVFERRAGRALHHFCH